MATPRCISANLRSIGKKGQLALGKSCIGVAGLGGVGGIAFELLVRSGVGRLRISDSGFFEESNANRQSLWSRWADGRKKTQVALEFASGVNPGCRVSAFPNIATGNSPVFAKGCTAVIDATDSVSSRLAVWEGCKRTGVPYIFSSALGCRGMLTVFFGRDFAQEFGLSGKEKKHFPCDHALGPVANAIGCLSAQQALNIALGKPAITFPTVLSFDALSPSPFSLHRF